MDSAQILTVFAVVAANLGTVITLYIQTDNKIEANRKEVTSVIESNRKETTAMINAIREDIRDFHGKLERQDAEFKAHIIHNHQKSQ
jgi:predicted TIM-barrel fold metal-dependent hydrolase